MYKTLITLFSLLLINASCIAQADSSNNDHSLLWKISGNGLEQPSYLFGTIHIICKDDFVWTDAMQNSIEQTEKICLEIDLDDPMLMFKVMQLMRAEDDKKLSDYFTKEEYTKVKKYFQDSFSVQLGLFNNMKPFVLMTLFKPSGSNCDSSVSYEFIMTAFAQKEKMEILGLETAEEQIAIFEKIPTDSVIKEVLDVVNDNGEESYEEMEELMSAYVAQDLAKLNELILSSEMSGMNMNDFIYQRNRNWIPKMKEYMKLHPTFFAVGAGHLGGVEGVIELLKNEGYTLTPVN